ncbi:MAG: glycosyltransferase [Acidimicrobiia bacterium]
MNESTGAETRRSDNSPRPRPNRIQRFVVVGLAVTAIDVAILLWLTVSRQVDAFQADLSTVAIATAFSLLLHPLVTMSRNPLRRWFDDYFGSYLSANIGSLCADVVVFTFLTARWGSHTAAEVLAAKAIALSAAVVIRLTAYRSLIRHAIRDDQRVPKLSATALLPTGVPRLSVIVPAYREGDRIAETVDSIRSDLHELHAVGTLEIIVVDDGSEDDTSSKAAAADAVLRLEPNTGKGAAIRCGMLAAHGNVRAFLDADLAYAPAQLMDLLARAEEGWEVVVGSRRHAAAHALVRTGAVRQLGSRAINALTSLVLLGQYRDTQCGIKAFRAEAAERIFAVARIDRFAADIEMLYLVERFRLSLVEVPVVVTNSKRSTVGVVTDTIRLVRDLVRIRVFARSGAYDA